MRQFSLADYKVAVVTGASEGIGEALALGLAEAGAEIIICSRREAKLKQVQPKYSKRDGGPKSLRWMFADSIKSNN